MGWGGGGGGGGAVDNEGRRQKLAGIETDTARQADWQRSVRQTDRQTDRQTTTRVSETDKQRD